MGSYFAVCDANHGVIRGWMGLDRETEAEAERDAEEHKEETYDHAVEVSYKP